MLKPSKAIMSLFVLLTCAAAPLLAYAAPKAVEPFDQKTWQQFQSTIARPSAVVFTTTDCTHCPAVIAKLAKDIKLSKQKAELIVVVMDGEGNPALLHDPHYKDTTRIFEFTGPTSALQYTVNPKWRGVTPYVALFERGTELKLITGTPNADDINRWLLGK
jgi:hypothetical protein